MEVGYQRIPSNPQVEHRVLRAAGVADFATLGPASRQGKGKMGYFVISEISRDLNVKQG